MAVKAERWSGLGQVVIPLDLALLANLVGDVASFTTHIKGCMPAPFVGNVHAHGVALEAEVLAFVAGVGLDQLILVVGLVWVMALDAIANRGRMNGTLQGFGILIVVTGETNGGRARGDELYAGDIFVDADLVAARTTHRDSGVYELSLGLVFVALDTFGRVGVLVQWNWMDGREYRARTQC